MVIAVALAAMMVLPSLPQLWWQVRVLILQQQ
jgi:hypothetical protein